MELHNDHLRLLRRASRKTVVCDGNKYSEMLNNLAAAHLIYFIIRNDGEKVLYYVNTTDKGKAALYEKTSSDRKNNIALVLSTIAIILTVLDSFTPFGDWAREFIQTLFS